MQRSPLSLRILLLTALALVSFAANSVLCRLALTTYKVDPAEFTWVRLASGAALLLLLNAFRKKPKLRLGLPDLISPALLLAYALCFSFAYIGLSAGTGALLLFGSVQATMLGVAIATRHRPAPYQWAGLALALGGLVYLVYPGLHSPPADRAALMIGAGVAWGVYSLRGRGVSDPVQATTVNFSIAALYMLVIGLGLIVAGDRTEAAAGSEGIYLAVASGAITSALGYVVWYSVVPSLGAARAAIVQLLVPVLAALGGVIVLGEVLAARLLAAGVLTISGVAMSLLSKERSTAPRA